MPRRSQALSPRGEIGLNRGTVCSWTNPSRIGWGRTSWAVLGVTKSAIPLNKSRHEWMETYAYQGQAPKPSSLSFMKTEEGKKSHKRAVGQDSYSD